MSTEQLGFAVACVAWVFQAGATWQRVASLEKQVAHLTDLIERALGLDAPRKVAG